MQRLYSFTSQINQVIIRTNDELTLFREVCRIAVDIGQFKMAWFGKIDDSTKTVAPIINQGDDMDYLKRIVSISVAEGPAANGPTGRAIKEDRFVVCNDIENDPQMQPWAKEALSRGYLSSIALPIKKNNRVIGAFTLYAGVKHFFDPAEIQLLREAAGDVSFALDVFEKEAMRKKAEASVLASERRYQTLAEISPVGIFHTDTEGITIYVNPRWCEISGMSFSEALGNGWLKNVHEDDRTVLFDGWTKAVQDGKLSVSEYRFVHADGSIAWVMGQAVQQKDHEDHVIGYVGTITEITERKKAEEKLLEREEKYRKAQAIGKMGHWELDTRTNSLSWSDEIYNLFDIPRDSFSNSNEELYERIHPEDRERFSVAQERALSGETKLDIIHRIIGRDGSTRYVHELGELSRDPQTDSIYLTGTVQDITEQIRSQQEIKETSEELRQLAAHLQDIREEERATMAREIHDELGQQLTGLKMDVYWLKDGLRPEDQESIRQIDGILHLVDQAIRTVRNIAASLRPFILDDLGLEEALRCSCIEFQQRFNIPVNFTSQLGDRALSPKLSIGLFRIFQECLTNVARHAEATAVTVRTVCRNDRIHLEISDNGRGFNIGEVAAKKTLGLVGMKERIYMLAGQYEINSDIGRGTHIYISVPLAVT